MTSRTLFPEGTGIFRSLQGIMDDSLKIPTRWKISTPSADCLERHYS